MTDYLSGTSHTMNTAGIQLSKKRAVELLTNFDAKMQNPGDKEEAKLYGEYFRRRFDKQVSK